MIHHQNPEMSRRLRATPHVTLPYIRDQLEDLATASALTRQRRLRDDAWRVVLFLVVGAIATTAAEVWIFGREPVQAVVVVALVAVVACGLILAEVY